MTGPRGGLSVNVTRQGERTSTAPADPRGGAGRAVSIVFSVIVKPLDWSAYEPEFPTCGDKMTWRARRMIAEALHRDNDKQPASAYRSAWLGVARRGSLSPRLGGPSAVSSPFESGWHCQLVPGQRTRPHNLDQAAWCRGSSAAPYPTLAAREQIPIREPRTCKSAPLLPRARQVDALPHKS